MHHDDTLEFPSRDRHLDDYPGSAPSFPQPHLLRTPLRVERWSCAAQLFAGMQAAKSVEVAAAPSGLAQLLSIEPVFPPSLVPYRATQHLFATTGYRAMTARSPKNVPFEATVSPTSAIPEAPVSSGWRVAVQQRPLGGPRHASPNSARRVLDGQNLFYSPLVTLWVFLSQVLSTDHSCRAAVARLVAHRVSRGQKPCSAETGAYCQARERLPEKFFADVACSVGRALDAKADHRWLWKGRRVYMFDGTTVTMPDTAENQQAYPQVYNQGPGAGFPIARVGAITSLSCGAVLNLGVCRYAGKGQGEVSLLRRLWDILRAGDLLLTDALMAGAFSTPPPGR